MASEGPKIRLITQEGENLEVDMQIAKQSQLIFNMLQDSGAEEDIPLYNVKLPTLKKVIEYLTHIKEHPAQDIQKPLKSANLHDVVGPWFANFVDLEQQLLFDVILAANYLDIKSLLELSCAKVASTLKGKTVEQIRKMYGIVNDFTPEEEAQIREENRWAEEAIN